MHEDLQDLILLTIETSLQAQLQAVRRLRKGSLRRTETSHNKGLSQVDMAYDILTKSHAPLHVSDLIARIEAVFAVQL